MMGLNPKITDNNPTFNHLLEKSMHPFTLELNARLRPLDRGDIYEDPLHEILEEHGLGETSGGGTGMGDNGEVAYCDVELSLKDNTPETLAEVIKIIETIGVPKGSFLRGEDYKEPVGQLEGLALYVNGTELADEVYENCDINHVISTICELIEGKGDFYSYNEERPHESLGNLPPSEFKKQLTEKVSNYELCA